MREYGEELKIPVISENKILSVLRTIRFGENPRCIYCGSETVIRWGYVPHSKKQRYLCKKCGATFNDLTGTPLENSKISIRDWVLIAHMFFNKGIRVSEIAKMTHHSPRTVSRVISITRENKLLKELLKKITSS